MDMEMSKMAYTTAGDHFNINKVMPDQTTQK